MSNRPNSKMHQRVKDAQAGKELKELGSIQKVAPNKFWDDANATYHASSQALAKAELYLLDVIEGSLNNPDRAVMVKDSNELAQAVNVLTRDLSAHHARLDGIYARHKDNKGGVTNMNDINDVLAIQDEYTTAANIFSSIIVRDQELVLDLLGLSDEAARHIQATPPPSPEQLAQDPTVITDVVAKSEQPSTEAPIQSADVQPNA